MEHDEYDEVVPSTADLLELADRCERGAAQLKHTAENAAAVLAERGYGDTRVDADTWAQQKRRAAVAAAEYADGLRREAAELGADGRPSVDRINQAERVAKAAEMDGILIDGRRMAEATATSGSIWHETERDLWAAGEHPDQRKAVEIEGTGMFGHVAGVIDGHDQVPYWQLGGPYQGAGLTPAQRELYDNVIGDPDGRDTYDLLQAADASPADKAAVADELGGPGAGDTLRTGTAEPTSPYEAGRRDWARGQVREAAAVDETDGPEYRRGMQDERTAQVDRELEQHEDELRPDLSARVDQDDDADEM